MTRLDHPQETGPVSTLVRLRHNTVRAAVLERGAPSVCTLTAPPPTSVDASSWERWCRRGWRGHGSEGGEGPLDSNIDRYTGCRRPGRMVSPVGLGMGDNPDTPARLRGR